MENNKELLAKIADHYGFQEQQRNAIEEMAELSVALCKLNRKDDVIKHPDALKRYRKSCVIEEIADVKIMVSQLEYLLGAEEKVARIMEMKINRQLERMESEKEK